MNLASRKSDLLWDYPSAVRVLDHDAPSGRTLVVDKLDQFQRGGELVVLEGVDTGGPKPLYRRQLPGAGKAGFAPQLEWARLLSGSHAADRGSRVARLGPARREAHLPRRRRSRSEPPALSGNQLYMAVSQGGKV